MENSLAAVPDLTQPSLGSTQQPTLQVYTIEGVIKNTQIIRSQHGKINLFTVLSVTSQKSYNIICTFFCPARKGDIIRGMCTEALSRNGQLQFLQDPTVEPASSEEAIKSLFIIYLKGTRFLRAAADRLYNFFQNKALDMINQYQDQNLTSEDEEAPILRNRDHLSSAVMEVISMYARRFLTDETVIQPLLGLGLSEEQCKKLMYGWNKSLSLRRLYLLGLTKKEINQSNDRGWTPNTLYYQLIENPYPIETIPMEKANKICQKYQLSFNQDMIEGGHLVRFVDEQCHKNGWSCHPIFALKKKYPRFSELEEVLKTEYQCDIRYNFLYLRFQNRVENELTRLLIPKQLPGTFCSNATKLQLCEEQVAAVEMALNNRVSIITGGPGTGKTTVISSICEEFELRGMGFLVSSFTGKAVARIKDVVRRQNKVMTLHMILSKGQLPPTSVLIVDELSMVPNELFCQVITRLYNLNKELQIVLVGDPEQIPPIQWGDLFNQLLGSRTIPTAYLTQDHRRKTQGVLFANMREFSLAEDPEEIQFRWGSDCIFTEGGIPEILSIVQELHQKGVSHSEITIISPFNEGLAELNEKCQEIFINKKAPLCLDAFGNTWKLGARVMMTTNRYDIDVMNGEEGVITGIFPDKIKVQFKKKDEVQIPTFEPVIMDEDMDTPLSTKLLTLSWAITIHKSQGSEWNHVIYYLPSKRGQGGFLNRKLHVTGTSRARECLYVVSSSEDYFLGIILVSPPSRYDNLAKRLCQEPYVNHYVNPSQALIQENMGSLSLN